VQNTQHLAKITPSGGLMPFNSNDLYDEYLESIQVASPIFKNFGGRKKFYGQIHTVKAFEDNTYIKEAFEEDGTGKVLVVDGAGSLRAAMMGDQVAALGKKNGWEGIIIFGCIRDSVDVGKLDFGAKALATIPRKTIKRQQGIRDITVHFADVCFTPNHYVYSDEDGILISDKPLI
jgi:regulator of ribonuclease activity A